MPASIRPRQSSFKVSPPSARTEGSPFRPWCRVAKVLFTASLWMEAPMTRRRSATADAARFSQLVFHPAASPNRPIFVTRSLRANEFPIGLTLGIGGFYGTAQYNTVGGGTVFAGLGQTIYRFCSQPDCDMANCRRAR